MCFFSYSSVLEEKKSRKTIQILWKSVCVVLSWLKVYFFIDCFYFYLFPKFVWNVYGSIFFIKRWFRYNCLLISIFFFFLWPFFVSFLFNNPILFLKRSELHLVLKILQFLFLKTILYIKGLKSNFSHS